MDSNLDQFLESCWAEHGDRPQQVAERLSASTGLIQAPADFAPYVRLVTHVFGEHLGQWQRAIELLAGLRRLPAFDDSASASGPVDQAVATMRFAAGDSDALETLPVEARISALSVAASAFAARGEHLRAKDAYGRALKLAEAKLPDGSPVFRALAITGNNLAVGLENLQQRDATLTEAMLTAAHAGLQYWKLAGTWLEEERAEYRLARSQLQAGQAQTAVASAQRCVAVCRKNGAPAFELFFGFAVLALAQRAAGDRDASDANRAEALRQLEQVPDDERPWCGTELAELAAMT